MTVKRVVECDQCGAAINEGVGRRFRIAAFYEIIPLKAGSELDPHGEYSTREPYHFCNHAHACAFFAEVALKNGES